MHVTHSQVDAEIEVADENEKELDSKEAETEVSKSQIYDVSFVWGHYTLLISCK